MHSRHFPASIGGYSSIGVGGPQSNISAGGEGNIVPGSTNGVTLGRRLGRLTSSSPLAGRSTLPPGFNRLGNLSVLSDEDVNMDDLDLDQSTDQALGGDDVGGRFNGEIQSPRLLSKREWSNNSFDQQTINFLEYVSNRIFEGTNEDIREDGAKKGEISFSWLIPPKSNTRAVATQALSHVLTLATKGALHVRQKEFGAIFLALSD